MPSFCHVKNWHATDCPAAATTASVSCRCAGTTFLQVRRNLHTYSPSQLVSVLSALASYAPGEGEPSSASGWHPGRLFLYDFITHSSPPEVVSAWSGRQAAQVLWAFSRFR